MNVINVHGEKVKIISTVCIKFNTVFNLTNYKINNKEIII